MGLDVCLYKTTKKIYEDLMTLEEKLVQKHKEFDDKDVRVWTGEEFAPPYTKEEREIIRQLHRQIDEVHKGIVEIKYWRKPYGLHAYVATNFVPEGGESYLDYIQLSRKNIEKLVQELKSNPTSFYTETFWDSEDNAKAIKIFESILAEYDDDTVILYFAC